jgi:predicted nucleotidyltransferase
VSFGISEVDMDYIVNTISDFAEVERAMIFGSRAMGNYKKGSDIDIALIGEKINFTTVAMIKEKLQEESPMPYLFDIVDVTHSNSEALKAHIQEYGIELYSRNQ